MKTIKTILLLLILFSTPYVQAGWILIDPPREDTSTDLFRLYLDASSIRHHGDRVTVSILMNYKEKTEDNINSALAVDEYDCIKSLVRSRSVVSFTELYGKGLVVREFLTAGAWSKVSPGKLNESVMERVCDFYPNWPQ